MTAGARVVVRKNPRNTPQIPFGATVEDLTHDGRGVVRVNGKAMFVPGALPGERVHVRVARRHRRFDEGRLEQVLESSPQRVTPRCPHFDECGGCTLQHLSPRGQIEYKEQQFLQTLRRVGDVEPETVVPALQADREGGEWGYRRRARLSVRALPGQKAVAAGFRKKRGSAIAALESCDVLAPAVGQRIRPLRELLGRLSLRARIPQIE